MCVVTTGHAFVRNDRDELGLDVDPKRRLPVVFTGLVLHLAGILGVIGMLPSWGVSMGEGRVVLSEVLLRGVEKVVGLQRSPVAGYVARLRRARPDMTPAEVIAVLERRYLAAVTGAGAAVGGVAAVPAVGAVLALALSGGETVVFLQATALFALAVAEVHGIGVEEVERRRALVLAVVVGDHGAMLVEKVAGHTGEHWGKLLPESVPMSSVTAVNKTFGGWLVTKYGRRRGFVVMGRVAPLGVGVVVGAGGNRACGRAVVDTSRRVFGPPPASFPDDGAVTGVGGVGAVRLGGWWVMRCVGL